MYMNDWEFVDHTNHVRTTLWTTDLFHLIEVTPAYVKRIDSTVTYSLSATNFPLRFKLRNAVHCKP